MGYYAGSHEPDLIVADTTSDGFRYILITSTFVSIYSRYLISS